jgi:hypothetical protein
MAFFAINNPSASTLNTPLFTVNEPSQLILNLLFTLKGLVISMLFI